MSLRRAVEFPAKQRTAKEQILANERLHVKLAVPELRYPPLRPDALREAGPKGFISRFKNKWVKSALGAVMEANLFGNNLAVAYNEKRVKLGR